jgi:hypothetical protein
MGLKSQYQVSMQQRKKRKKAREQLTKKGENIASYYYGKYYIKQA